MGHVRREVTRLQAPLHPSAKHHMARAFVENPALIGHLSGSVCSAPPNTIAFGTSNAWVGQLFFFVTSAGTCRRTAHTRVGIWAFEVLGKARARADVRVRGRSTAAACDTWILWSLFSSVFGFLSCTLVHRHPTSTVDNGAQEATGPLLHLTIQRSQWQCVGVRLRLDL